MISRSECIARGRRGALVGVGESSSHNTCEMKLRSDAGGDTRFREVLELIKDLLRESCQVDIRRDHPPLGRMQRRIAHRELHAPPLQPVEASTDASGARSSQVKVKAV